MRGRFRIVLAAILICTSPVLGQERLTDRLLDAAWNRGADAALEVYASLPAADRTPTLLVSVSDQLLWTGKPVEASALLDRAAREAPLLAEIRFQQGRAALQRADLARALAAFRAGAGLVDRDTSLTAKARASLRGRLDARIGLLERGEALRSRAGGYRLPDGGVLLFKFDPYLNTFPALLQPASGWVRTLYPAERGGLEWRNEAGIALGWVTFSDPAGNEGVLVVRDSTGERRAAGLGIRKETLRFESAGASIEGTLFRPRGGDVVPAVALSHGAGLSSRYNLALEAIAFAAAGVAAFVYDKPGLGTSSGGNWLLLSIEDQVAYALAAVDRLSSRPDIGPVGVWGFSQGGWVAPMAANRGKNVAFVVMVSGAAVGPQEQQDQAVEGRLQRAGLPRSQVEAAMHHARTVWATVNAGGGPAELDSVYRAAEAPWSELVPRLTFQWEIDWWRANHLDPSVALRSLDVPLLALFGEGDDVVPHRVNVPLLAADLAASRTGDYTIAVLPGADHQMRSASDYHPRYFPTMVEWVRTRFVRGSPSR